MGKYSSDSDYEKRTSKKHKSSTRKRSSSSDTSDSKTRCRKAKKSDRYRSKSKDRYSRLRRSRSRSISHHRSHKLKHRRSTSRDRSKRTRSNSRDRHRNSRDKYRSHRSRSRSYIREFISKPKRQSSSSSSSDSDSVISIEKKLIKEKRTDRTNSDFNNIADKVIVEPVVNIAVLEDINSEGFMPKKFNSKKVPDNIVIDLTKQTIKVPEVEPSEPDSIFHHNLFLSEETRMEKWVKELYSYRQKALQQGLKTN